MFWSVILIYFFIFLEKTSIFENFTQKINFIEKKLVSHGKPLLIKNPKK